MLAVWNDPAFVQHVGDRGVRSTEQARMAIAEGPLEMYRRYGYGPYKMVLKEDGRALGICGLFKREYLDDPDLGYAVLPAYRGKGYAGEAARRVLIAAAEAFALPRVAALIAPDNRASIVLIEKLGFTLRGRHSLEDDDETLLYGFDFAAGPDV